jgi:multicomponent Na+:H+ antiporter subunit G
MIDLFWEILTSVMLLVGGLLMVVAALGLVRMPDLLTRMHATTKAGALGGGLTVLAVAIHFGEPEIVARALAVVIFIVLTAPVAAHAIGRASYFVGVPLWEGTVKDELKGRYDAHNHQLHSSDEAAETAKRPGGDSTGG